MNQVIIPLSNLRVLFKVVGNKNTTPELLDNTHKIKADSILIKFIWLHNEKRWSFTNLLNMNYYSELPDDEKQELVEEAHSFAKTCMLLTSLGCVLCGNESPSPISSDKLNELISFISKK